MNILFVVMDDFKYTAGPKLLYKSLTKLDINVRMNKTSHVLYTYLIDRVQFKKIDIVHVCGIPSHGFMIYKLLFGWIDRTPLVVTWFDSPRAQSRIFNRITSRVIDLLIVESNEEKDLLIARYSFDNSRVKVVNPGVDTSRYYPMKDKQLILGNEVLCIADMVKNSNVELLIDIVKYLPTQYNVRCVYRSFDEEYLENMKALTRNLKVDYRVVFERMPEDVSLVGYLMRASVFFLPFEIKYMTNAVMQALASGVLSFIYYDDAPDIVGLCKLKTKAPKQIAKYIKDTVDTGIRVDNLVVKNVLGWDARAKEIEGLYRSLLV